MIQAVGCAEGRNFSRVLVNQQLMITLGQIQRGEELGASHRIQLIFDSVHWVRVFNYILIQHPEVDTDSNIPVRFWNTHHRCRVWTVALLN